MTLLLISCAAFFSTLLGGLCALRLKDRLHLILGFSAGAIIAVAFFDLLPEALELTKGAYEVSTMLALTALGFVGYLVLDRSLFMHGHTEHDGHKHRGVVGATSLTLHSFLDGLGIGLAFQVSTAVGVVVAAAVLAHDFSDGINTVGMILKNSADRMKAFRWLLIDAFAPAAGVLATFFLHVPEAQLGMLLALFAGFFLYIGASDLIPESYHAHPTRWTTLMTLLGVVVLYCVIRLAGI